MKLRLLSVLLAATALGGCATYDYAGGGDGGYYHGRPTVDHYGGYGAYGGYGGYPAYGYGRYGYSRYYGGYGYYPYHLYSPYPRYYIVRPPHDGRGDHHDHDHDRDPPGDERPRGERPPPWRRPDGRYQDSGSVMIPGQRDMPRPMVPSQVGGSAPPPRASVQPPAPRLQRAERPARSERPEPPAQERPAGREMIRTQEE